MKIKEITLRGREDPVGGEFVEVSQKPAFSAALRQQLDQAGYADIWVEIEDIASSEVAALVVMVRSMYQIQVTMSSKTSVERFEILLDIVSSEAETQMVSAICYVTYMGIRRIFEVEKEDIRLMVSPSEIVALIIVQMAATLFGNTLCRV